MSATTEFYQTTHACEQLFDRYGIPSTRPLWREAFLDVIEGRSLLLGRQSNGRERHIVRMMGVAVLLVYCPHMAKFLTALPQEAARSLPRD